MSLKNWLIQLIDSDALSEKVKAKIATISWMLWKERRTMVFEKEMGNPDSIIRKIDRFLHSTAIAVTSKQNSQATKTNHCSNRSNVWEPPDSSQIKITHVASF